MAASGEVAVLELTVPAEVRQIRVIRLLTRTALETLTSHESVRIQRLLVAISEVFNNAVRTSRVRMEEDEHSPSASVEFRLTIRGGEVSATVIDQGGGFTEHRRRDTGGLGTGLEIAEAFSDGLEIHSSQGRTAVTLLMIGPS